MNLFPEDIYQNNQQQLYNIAVAEGSLNSKENKLTKNLKSKVGE